MSDHKIEADKLPGEAVGQEASSRLSEGLESCRTVVANYRAMLVNDPAASPEPAPAAQPADGKS